MGKQSGLHMKDVYSGRLRHFQWVSNWINLNNLYYKQKKTKSFPMKLQEILLEQFHISETSKWAKLDTLKCQEFYIHLQVILVSGTSKVWTTLLLLYLYNYKWMNSKHFELCLAFTSNIDYNKFMSFQREDFLGSYVSN